MKKFVLLISLLLFHFSTSYAAEEVLTPTCQAHKRKVYVSPAEVQIKENGIFVFVASEWIQMTSLFSDNSGIYIERDQFLPWLCGRCGRWTTGWFVCEWCGNPK